jgi:hypothetical protein
VVREEGHDKHRPASAAIASANLCCSDDGTPAAGIPEVAPMPESVLEYVVEALSSAVKLKKYMG